MYKNYPFGLMAVERMIKYNNLKIRADIVVYNSKGVPVLIVECKASNIKINQDVFDQIARYNFQLKVRYLIVTNGINHFCCEMDYTRNKIIFLDEIPIFNLY